MLKLESNQYAIKLENFEGPLDLLCHLIDKNKMDVCDISISRITEQYLAYLHSMEELNLEIASEFLIMASTLLYLKSKSLLPKQEENEEKELTEEELLQRIMEYKKYKEITKTLSAMYQTAGVCYEKPPENIELPKQTLENPYQIQQLITAYEQLVHKNEEKVNQNAKNMEKIALVETYSVGSKVKEMYKALWKHRRFVFNKLFSLQKCNTAEVVTAFSGMLEMSRRKKVTTKQDVLFGDILVEKVTKKSE